MEEKRETFTYTYSADRQEKIKRIREKYAPPAQEEDKMERLRRLDQSATRPGSIAALAVGTLGTLTMGLGMCCTMVWAQTLFLPGIAIGAAGILCICAAYPLYLHLTRRRREKLADEIIRLADELMNETAPPPHQI